MLPGPGGGDNDNEACERDKGSDSKAGGLVPELHCVTSGRNGDGLECAVRAVGTGQRAIDSRFPAREELLNQLEAYAGL